MSKKMISLEELKKIELDVLVEVHKVCMEQGFRYSLAGGTLIKMDEFCARYEK